MITNWSEKIKKSVTNSKGQTIKKVINKKRKQIAGIDSVRYRKTREYLKRVFPWGNDSKILIINCNSTQKSFLKLKGNFKNSYKSFQKSNL